MTGALIYIRVSTEEQAKHGYSLWAQEEACRKKAEDLGGCNIIVYRDEGITGAVLERPGLQHALQSCKSPEYSFFIVYDPDRLSRKLAHQLMLVDSIEKAGCRLEFVNFEWQDTPEGRLFYSLRGAIAEYEKEKFRARSKFGKLAKARKGLLTHSPGIYGYRYNSRTSTLEINEEEAVIYRRIVDMALEGDSPEIIAETLNKERISGPRGGVWYRTTVRRILKNSTYTGIINLNMYMAGGVKASRASGNPAGYKCRPEEEWIAVTVPPLIPVEKWRALQDYQEKMKRGNRGKKVYTYMLSGLLFCGVCGALMHGSSIKKPGGKLYRYYVCPGRRGNRKCTMKTLNAQEIEDVLWQNLSCCLKDPELMVGDVSVDYRHSLTEEKSMLLKKIESINKEQERIFEAYRYGLIDMNKYNKYYLELQAKYKSLLTRHEKINDIIEDNNVNDLKYAQKVVENLYLLNLKERAYIVTLLVEQVIVTPSLKIYVKSNIDKI